MLAICGRFRVAVRRARKHDVIRRINMAVRALSAVMGKRVPNMVEQRVCPGRGVVAGFAGGRESRPDVVRIDRAQVIGLVATVTICWCGLVIGGEVAAGAEHGEVEAGQGEEGFVVIKRGRHPGGSGMAEVAGLREA